jgi:hypothetical protein
MKNGEEWAERVAGCYGFAPTGKCAFCLRTAGVAGSSIAKWCWRPLEPRLLQPTAVERLFNHPPPNSMAKLVTSSVLHACIHQHVSPFPTCTGMTVLQVLAKMVGSVEFFSLIAFAKFVHLRQVFDPVVPTWLRMIWKLFSTISAGIIGRPVRVKSGLKSGNCSA